jgi:hypothetical protein
MIARTPIARPCQGSQYPAAASIWNPELEEMAAWLYNIPLENHSLRWLITYISRTEDKALEEEIDPAHDDHLRDHHYHLRLHTSHHAVHGCRVGHGVRGRRRSVTFRWTVFEILSSLVCFRKVVRDGFIKCRWYGRICRGSLEKLRTRQCSPEMTVTKKQTMPEAMPTNCSRIAARGNFLVGDWRSRTT